MKEKATEDKGILVFVYGSLKRGFSNYKRLLDGSIGDCEYLHVATTKGTMYDLGPFPAVDIEGPNQIRGEVFRVDEDVLFALDRLEGDPTFYNRTKVDLSTGEKAWIYHISRNKINSNMLVPDGDWRKK